MKVLFIPEIGIQGGCRTYFFSLLPYLSQNHQVFVAVDPGRHDKKVLSAINKYSQLSPTSIGNYFSSAPVGFIRVLLIAIYDLIHFIPLYLKYRPELVVVSTGNPPKLLSLAFFPIKFLYIVHSYPRVRSRALFHILLTKLFNYHKKVVTVSNYSKRKIVSSWFSHDATKVVAIHNHTKPLSQETHKLRSHVEILTIGTNMEAKNPDQWLDVIKLINKKNDSSKIHFTWVGAGDWGHEYEKRIAASGVNNATIVGFSDNLSPFYLSADIYFQPSRIESHGMSVVEAMSLGLPCVVSKVGGLPESVSHNTNGYVYPLSQPKLAASYLLKLINNSSLRKAMGRASKTLYHQKFTKKVWQEKMDLLIEQLL